MERLSNKSEIQIARNTECLKVQPTTVAFREYYRVTVYPNTPANPNTPVGGSKDTFSFSIHPTLPSELDLQKCNLHVKFKVTKNGAAYTLNDQIVCVQSLGVLAWEYVKVMVAGKEVFPDFRQENHTQYIKMETNFSQDEKDNLLNQVGYRKVKVFFFFS